MLRLILGGLALCAAALAQQTFEVASLKPSAPSDGANPRLAELQAKTLARMYDSHPRGWLPVQKGRLTVKNQALAGLIASAYRMRQSEVSGPSWMADARFDIEATFPEGTPKTAVTDMLRALLEERFGLAVHREEKEAAGYALVVAKGGAKLTPAAEQEQEEAPPVDEEARRAAINKAILQLQAARRENYDANSWRAANVTLAQVADWLSPLVGKPVTDATGIDGKYDLDLQVVRFGDDTQEYAVAQALANFGLKLEARKVTVSTVVVDRVERKPKEN